MNIKIVQLSDAEKIRCLSDMDKPILRSMTLLRREMSAYQIVLFSDVPCSLRVNVESKLNGSVNLYVLKDAVMDYPGKPSWDDDYITGESGTMPDILVPIEEQNYMIQMSESVATVWVEVTPDVSCKPGSYPIMVSFNNSGLFSCVEQISVLQVMQVSVLPIEIKNQETVFTQWFHTDCISSYHDVPIYSEEHWRLIDRYMKSAVELGINMILTPIITPPLDVNQGLTRPCTQLVKITKCGEKYIFDFALLKRWISLCKKNGFKYYEMAHLFSQWGLDYSPNILIFENGVAEYRFGWNVPARDLAYRNFLEQFLPELILFLESVGIKENTYFHLSDEPRAEHLDNYRYARDLVEPLISGCPIIDALSDIDFYKTGLVMQPVTATDAIEPFLNEKVENQWVYYCCSQSAYVGNRFMAMPSYRNRILGLQLYKYGIKGFLHWGFNFYNSQRSFYKINPFVTTSADMSFPSGDSFTVYPGANGVYFSTRGKVFKEALQDIELLKMLEAKIGKEKVVGIIEEEAGMELTFSYYPRNAMFIPNLMNKIRNKLNTISEAVMD